MPTATYSGTNKREVLNGVETQLNALGLNHVSSHDNEHGRRAYLTAHGMRMLYEHPGSAPKVWNPEGIESREDPFDVLMVEFTREIDAYKKETGKQERFIQ